MGTIEPSAKTTCAFQSIWMKTVAGEITSEARLCAVWIGRAPPPLGVAPVRATGGAAEGCPATSALHADVGATTANTAATIVAVRRMERALRRFGGCPSTRELFITTPPRELT